ncbi:hypothetical protein L1987_21562 [Smallanthus sonchifolius]|uniref:Uncharacterized protein n=1 Tax=Smallanthus sonchifolius TaxID=185202 RepID=A0ACB9IV02_9ASTR|nr:hypothetical protein L1987_21562 [Smallanthus sonchifolius]
MEMDHVLIINETELWPCAIMEMDHVLIINETELWPCAIMEMDHVLIKNETELCPCAIMEMDHVLIINETKLWPCAIMEMDHGLIINERGYGLCAIMEMDHVLIIIETCSKGARKAPKKLKLSGNLIPRGTRRTGIGSLAVREGQGFRRCFEGSPRGTRELAGKSLAVRERPGFRACFWDSLAVREGGGQNASRVYVNVIPSDLSLEQYEKGINYITYLLYLALALATQTDIRALVPLSA